MFRYDKQIEIIQARWSQDGLRLGFGLSIWGGDITALQVSG